MTKRAMVTGVTGQDGAYLAKHLQDLGYDIIGLVRRSSSSDFIRMRTLGVDLSKLTIDTFELCEPINMQNLIRKHKPDEIYNLAAQTFVASSFETPLYTMEANANGVYRWMDALLHTDRNVKFYQASTSEMFGLAKTIPQHEDTPFHPRSPYGVAKLAAHWFVKNYRESYDLFACNGILFNHESPLRGTEFVTRKITHNLCKLHAGKGGPVRLGNLNSVRDWGHAADYVRAMHLMMQQDTADDYVIGSDEVHSVREFCEIAASFLGYDLTWEGTGVDEVGIDRKSGKVLIQVDLRFMRPAEVEYLQSDCSRAKSKLGWTRKYTFRQIVEEMIRYDLELSRAD